MTATGLIDRGEELARLADLLAGAERGEPAFVLLSGEAGVGKSRVLDEFVTQVAEDVDVLVGACIAVGDAGLPFAPVTEVLRRLVRGRSAERMSELLDASRFELARLVPQVLGDEVEPPERATSATQARLFSAVLDAFEQLAEDKPLVVAFENLHWADESTLALVQYMARNLRDARTLVLGTLRTDELQRSHPRRRLLSELARVPAVTQVHLAPFGREEVAAQIAMLLDSEPDMSMVDEIAARSDGNPFFVEELLARYRVRGGSGLSGTLRDVLLSPLEALPHETRQLVDVIATVGRPVGHRLLGVVTGRSARELAELLRPAVEHHLLAEGADGRYGFRHALTQEAVYTELLGSERASLHRMIAETLSSHRELAAGGSENVDAELARHWDAAQLPSEAFRASLAAAACSRRMRAYAAGLGHVERALALWEHRPDNTPVSQAEVLMGAADMARWAGEYAREAGHLHAVLAAGDGDTGEQEAELRRRYSLALYRSGNGEQAMQEIERVLAFGSDALSAEQRAFALAWHARGVATLTGLHSAQEPARDTLEAARAASTPHPEAVALMLLGTGLAAKGRHAEGIAHLEEALGIAEEERDADLLTWAYHDLLSVLITARRDDEAQVLSEQALAWIDDGADREAATALVVSKIAWQLLAVGGWDQAERVLNRAARQVPTGPHYVGLLVVRALLRLYQGRLDAAATDLAQASRAGALSDRRLSGPWFALEASRAAFEGRVTQAREAGENALTCDEEWKIDVHPLVHVVRAEVDAVLRASAAERDRRLARAHEGVTRLQRLWADGAEAVVQRWGLDLDKARAEAELSRATGPDPRRWRELLRTEKHVFWRLYERWRLAESLLATGEPDDAADELRAGHSMAGDLGAELLRSEFEALARRAGLTVAGVDAGDPGIGDLTPRELDVLRLVALGRTNQEIAAELYIAPKTASVHLSKILSKLGVDNRVQAATVAERHGFGAPGRPSTAGRGSPP